MKIYIQKTQEKKEMRFSGKVLALLRKLGINPETVLVTKNGTLATDENTLSDTDDVEILQVVSGG